MSNQTLRLALSGLVLLAGASAAVQTSYKTAKVGELTIAYREAGDAANPKLVLLHGFPASSHQYRDLIRRWPHASTSSPRTTPGSATATCPIRQPTPTRSTRSRKWWSSSSRIEASTITGCLSRTTADRLDSASSPVTRRRSIG